MHPGQKLKPGARVLFEGDGVALHGEVLARHFYGRRTVRLWTDAGVDVQAAIDRLGHIPLPPYIKRDGPAVRSRALSDCVRARPGICRGADRRPSLHDCGCSTTCARAASSVAEITLHVGYGTFKPVRSRHGRGARRRCRSADRCRRCRRRA